MIYWKQYKTSNILNSGHTVNVTVCVCIIIYISLFHKMKNGKKWFSEFMDLSIMSKL